MPNFYLVWTGPDAPNSVIIDAPNAKLAAERGASHYGEAAPDKVFPVPALLGEVIEDGDGVLHIEPAEHVLDLFDAFEDGEAPPAPTGVFCIAEADGDDDELLHCCLAPEHTGKHRAADGSEWSDLPEVRS